MRTGSDSPEHEFNNGFGDAIKADKKARLRTLKDLDQAAATLASACQMLLDTRLPDAELRTRL
jgi:hypothetical protein